MFSLNGFSQDCINYWRFSDKPIETYSYTNKYFVVPEGCFSQLLSRTESMEVIFEIVQARDYKITIGSELKNAKPIIKVYNYDDNVLMYDNTQNDSVSIFEFEVMVSRKVKAVVSLPKIRNELVDKNKYDPRILMPKVNRYCVGIKLETMVTRK